MKTDLNRTVAVSESYFALANIRHAENNLLPRLQEYGMEYDEALQHDIHESIRKLREEVNAYEQAVKQLFTTANPRP